MPALPMGVYLHVPFCRQKCPYCSFNVYARRSHLIPTYLEALLAEWSLRVETLPSSGPVAFTPDGHPRVATIYVGGGTPSLLRPEDLGTLLHGLRARAAMEPDAEITVETEPGTIDAAGYAGLRALGVTRVTIGVQSFQAAHLRRLGRQHGPDEARAAIAGARAAGFDNFDLDLMFGLPDQTPADFEADLEEALSVHPTHLSLYNLTVEPQTPFAAQQRKGLLPLPDEDVQATMFALALRRTAEAGLPQYEISNFARPGFASRHNRGYWTGAPYLGLGAGAHGFLPAPGPADFGRRWWNLRSPERYIAAAERGELPEDGSEQLDRGAAMLEALYLGLRQRSGLALQAFEARFGLGSTAALLPEVRRLETAGKLAADPLCLRLSEEGVLVADFIIERLAALLDTTA